MRVSKKAVNLLAVARSSLLALMMAQYSGLNLWEDGGRPQDLCQAFFFERMCPSPSYWYQALIRMRWFSPFLPHPLDPSLTAGRSMLCRASWQMTKRTISLSRRRHQASCTRPTESPDLRFARNESFVPLDMVDAEGLAPRPPDWYPLR